jgi:hypothetical protein
MFGCINLILNLSKDMCPTPDNSAIMGCSVFSTEFYSLYVLCSKKNNGNKKIGILEVLDD